MIDLTGYSPEALEALREALDKAKAPGGASGPRPPQLEDIKPGMSAEQTRAVCDAIRAAIERP